MLRSVPPVSRESCSFPVRVGYEALPLVDSLEYYRAIEQELKAASKRIWLGISFFLSDFWFPQSKQKFFDFMNDLLEMKPELDVRLIFWRNPKFSLHPTKKSSLFNGDSDDLRVLAATSLRKYPNFQIRWNESPDRHHCHHEKSWIIDNVAFIGGLTLSTHIVDSSHKTYGHHDAGVKVSQSDDFLGDVSMHFLQRWRGCTKAWDPKGCSVVPITTSNEELGTESPKKRNIETNEEKKQKRIQLLRSVRAKLYDDIPEGEESILKAYEQAFASARETIYIENQHVAHPQLLDALRAAVMRGVEVFIVAPAPCLGPGRVVYQSALSWLRSGGAKGQMPRWGDVFLDHLPQFQGLSGFTLCGLAVARKKLEYVYVHAKIAIVDEEWVTIGSANLVDLSFEKDHTELNCAFWDRNLASFFLRKLLREHFGKELGDLTKQSGKTLLRAASKLARKNRRQLQKGAFKQYQMYCFEQNVATYGEDDPLKFKL
eukprot:TRINITY_DN20559_c0_g1_i1.p1 TRINITY_DN20559_c0_g1~~TRINITY_DN20559_c0_g1_i1.p1  ORF type:complete len:486 (-),score=62.62 TRINITY_DN20559_c0_g1_i1:217-1674(-)